MKKFIVLLSFIFISISSFSFDFQIFNKFENFYNYNIIDKNDNSNSPNYDMYATVARKLDVDGWLVIYEVKGENPKEDAKEYFDKQFKHHSNGYTKTNIDKNIVVFESIIDGRIKLYFLQGNIVGRYESKADNNNLKNELDTVVSNFTNFH